MARCEDHFLVVGSEDYERCDNDAISYCSNCDQELCVACASECVGECELAEGLRPQDPNEAAA